MSYFFIALGGSIGAISRFLVSNMFLSSPKGIILCNLLGSFLMGIVFALISNKLNMNKDLVNFFTIGFLGSFTTFSTFSLNIYQLYSNKEYLFLLTYFTSSVFGSVFLLIIGIYLTEIVIKL